MIFPAEKGRITLKKEAPEVYRDWGYDFQKGRLSEHGSPRGIVERREALKVWIGKALRTPRGVYAAYSQEYGHELERLAGITDFGYFQEAAAQTIVETLLTNPYIASVTGFVFEKKGAEVVVSFTVHSTYGEIKERIEVER